MGYFDSPKNAAKWNIAMQELRTKREDFEKNPEKKILGTAGPRLHENAVTFLDREPVTYPQLVTEERLEAQMLRSANSGNVKNMVQDIEKREQRSLAQRTTVNANKLTVSALKPKGT